MIIDWQIVKNIYNYISSLKFALAARLIKKLLLWYKYVCLSVCLRIYEYQLSY